MPTRSTALRPVPTPAAGPIDVMATAEYTPVATVVMCEANPMRVGLAAVRNALTPSVLRQLARNRWAPYDYRVVREQQRAFAAVLAAHGAEVVWARNVPDLGTQHYTRDVGFVIDDVFFFARMGTPYRARELAGLEPLRPRLSKTATLSEGRIEGGDVMLHDGAVLVGLGEASDVRGVGALRVKLDELGIEREVVPLEFTHGGTIHLDTKFNIVAPGVALVSPKSFTPATLRWFERHFDLVAATPAETRRLDINTVALGGGKVVVSRAAGRIADRLAERGLTPVPVEYGEVTKFPGSFRCTTLPLARRLPVPQPTHND